MNWLELTIHTAHAGIETVAAALTAAGFEDLVLEDQAEFESFLEENRQYWDYIDESLQAHLQGLSHIKLYLEDTDTQSLARLKALLHDLRGRYCDGSLGSLELTVTTLAQQDWEESWKENYPPQPVGDKLLVLPCWLADAPTQGRLPVILDPGLTFGTGAHPSTQMVMAVMEKQNLTGCTCLDLGSGSGILSITALRLGAKEALGVDIDPKAETVARENAAWNGFDAPAFTAITGNVIADRRLMDRLAANTYDLVLVNIVADVIIQLAPILPQFVSGKTLLICSGILDTRLAEVVDALQQVGLTVTETLQKEDWRCIAVQRRPL